MDPAAVPATDVIVPFQIEAFGLRGRFVRLGGALEAMLANHGYPAPVQELLGEAAALTAVLAGALKYDGLFTLQIQGDGPVSLMVVDMTSRGQLRAFARFDAQAVSGAAWVKGDPLPRLVGSGHMAFTVDQGEGTERYQGIVELAGTNLADCAHAYFRQSEQIETAIALGAVAAKDGPLSAAALMVQRLPDPLKGSGEDDDDWHHAVVLLSSISRTELTDAALPPNKVLYRLYHQEGVRIYEPKALSFGCRCSRERVATTLRSFPRDEIEGLFEEGTIDVSCEFCGAEYVFDHDQVAALFDSLRLEGDPYEPS